MANKTRPRHLTLTEAPLKYTFLTECDRCHEEQRCTLTDIRTNRCRPCVAEYGIEE